MSPGEKRDTVIDIFVRFKQKIDSSITSGLDTMFGGASTSQDGLKAAKQSNDFDPQNESEINLHHILSDRRYSPAALTHLPQPVPNGLPYDIDRTAFTFADAFEDLLVETKTGRLPDIRQRHQQRKMLSSMFPHGEPQEFMRRRLEAQGLLPDYQKAASDAFNLMWKDYEQRVNETWKSYEELYKIGGAGEVLSKLYDTFGFPKEWRSDPWKDWRHDDDSTSKALEQRNEPNNYDEMFDTVRSMVDSGQRTWDTFIKSLGDYSPSSESAYEPSHYVVAPSQEPKTVEERDEYVDKFGYVHSTVIRRQYDKHGNEIGRSTSSRIYPAPKQGLEGGQPRRQQQQQGKEYLGEEEKKKLGWFWK